MGSFHRIRLSEFDSTSLRLVIFARSSPESRPVTIFAEDYNGNSCRPISIYDLGYGINSARTKILLENKYPNGRLRREWVKLQDSVDDLRHIFKLVGQDMPPVTQSFLSRLGNIQSFVAVLR
jgi:hypothetical protein